MWNSRIRGKEAIGRDAEVFLTFWGFSCWLQLVNQTYEFEFPDIRLREQEKGKAKQII